MKQTFFLPVLFPVFLFGQTIDKPVIYKIDRLKSDSFYLAEFYYGSDTNKTRQDTLLVYTLFVDTSDFRAYINDLSRDARRLERQYLPAKIQYDSISNRVDRLKHLALESFGMSVAGGVSSRSMPAPIIPQPGFWVLYPPDSRAEYIFSIDKIRGDALILNHNGTSMLFEVPKRLTKKTIKSKSKKGKKLK